MLFEVFNMSGSIVFVTSEINCLPEDKYINSMYENGYKFKFNGKNLSKKALHELIKQKESNENEWNY